MTRSPRVPGHTSRRTVVTAAGAVGLAATLAACGTDDSDDTGRDTGDTSGGGSGGDSGGQTGGGTELAKTSEIPEGGGTIFKDENVVVVQPTAGEYKAYSSVCTHVRCQVSEVKDGTINCNCHGSKFSVVDGSVSAGPATKPLPAADNVTVEGDSIRIR